MKVGKSAVMMGMRLAVKKVGMRAEQWAGKMADH